MDVGIFLDLRNPPPWRTNSARLYGFTLEMCEEAERLGAGSIWVSEHHLFEDGYLTQPLTFLAAAAARTKKARLGTAILLAPLRPAVTIAEQATVVDLISNGRVEIGLGAGYRIPEFQLYGADFPARFKTTDARALEIGKLFAEGKLTPAPVQNPVPIWMGYQTEKGAERAGRMGLGLLSARGALWPAYKSGLVAGGHDPSVGRMAGMIGGWISEDPDAEWPVVSKYLAYQQNTYKSYGVEGTGKPAPEVDVEKMRWRDGELKPHHFMIATPQKAAELIKGYTADAPVKHIYFFVSLAGMPEKMVMKQIETVFTKLAPLLK